jgi:hypothetical protein
VIHLPGPLQPMRAKLVFPMPHTVAAYDTHGQAHNHNVDRHPDYCPFCHHAIEPKALGSSFYIDLMPSVIETLYRCPRHRCGHAFIARYRLQGMYGSYGLNECVPYELQDLEFPAEIVELSPDFCAISNQAKNAELQRLSLIAGAGYRKALEFLVKDYVIRLRPTDAEQIKKTDLGSCIQTYINNPMVKDTAQRAAWLGNDEVHYLRKWEEHDLEDLKELIQLVLTTIHSELIYSKMKLNMPKGKK